MIIKEKLGFGEREVNGCEAQQKRAHLRYAGTESSCEYLDTRSQLCNGLAPSERTTCQKQGYKSKVHLSTQMHGNPRNYQKRQPPCQMEGSNLFELNNDALPVKWA